MSKMLHEYCLICSFLKKLFKKSEFGCVEKQYLQLNINLKGCCMLCLKEKQPIFGEMSYQGLSENLKKSQKSLFLVKNSVFVQKSVFSFIALNDCFQFLERGCETNSGVEAHKRRCGRFVAYQILVFSKTCIFAHFYSSF